MKPGFIFRLLCIIIKGVKEGDYILRKVFLNPFVLILLFILVISLIFNYNYFKSAQKEDSNDIIFINDFYHELNEAISTIHTLISQKPNEEDFQKQFIRLTRSLDILDFMVMRVPYYTKGIGGFPNDIGEYSYAINYGTSTDGHQIPPFREELKLNPEEKEYLNSVMDFLIEIRNDLQSEDTGDLNQNINHYYRVITDNLVGSLKPQYYLDEYINDVNE